MKIKIIGVDYSSAPNKNKPIIVAVGYINLKSFKYNNDKNYVAELTNFISINSLENFDVFLNANDNWVGGFDLPFSMPRKLIEKYKWPKAWEKFVQFYCSSDKVYLRDCFKTWCDSREIGNKFAWRKTDIVSGSSPAMRWTNPPVAWMMHSGLMRMIRANLYFPSHSYPLTSEKTYSKIFKKSNFTPVKIALETYPAFRVRKVTKKSYKSDDRRKHNTDRLELRKNILSSLTSKTKVQKLKLDITKEMTDIIISDGKGDYLDAVICMLQAGESVLKTNFGLSDCIDSLEGWIIIS